MTIAEQLRLQGLKKGLEKGLEKGRKQMVQRLYQTLKNKKKVAEYLGLTLNAVETYLAKGKVK